MLQMVLPKGILLFFLHLLLQPWSHAPISQNLRSWECSLEIEEGEFYIHWVHTIYSICIWPSCPNWCQGKGGQKTHKASKRSDHKLERGDPLKPFYHLTNVLWPLTPIEPHGSYITKPLKNYWFNGQSAKQNSMVIVFPKTIEVFKVIEISNILYQHLTFLVVTFWTFCMHFNMQLYCSELLLASRLLI